MGGVKEGYTGGYTVSGFSGFQGSKTGVLSRIRASLGWIRWLLGAHDGTHSHRVLRS